MPPLKTICFGLVMVLYLWVPYAMISHQEKIWTEGEVHRFRLAPVDPYDAFRGRYVNLSFGRIQFDKVAQAEDYYPQQNIYLSLAKDSLGYSYFSGYSLKPLVEEDYIASKITYTTDAKISVALPENMRRYYMNEELAPLAEKLTSRWALRQNAQKIPIYAEVSCLAGEVQIRELYFGEEVIDTYLRKQLDAPEVETKEESSK